MICTYDKLTARDLSFIHRSAKRGKIDKLPITIKNRVLSEIEKLPFQEQTIAYQYFMEGKSAARIGINLCYCERQVYRILARAKNSLIDAK